MDFRERVARLVLNLAPLQAETISSFLSLKPNSLLHPLTLHFTVDFSSL